MKRAAKTSFGKTLLPRAVWCSPQRTRYSKLEGELGFPKEEDGGSSRELAVPTEQDEPAHIRA